MANNLDAFIPEAWSRSIITQLNQLNVAMMVAANGDYEGEIREAGDTVHVRTVGRVTLRDYQRGGTVTYEDLTPTKETMTVDTAKYFAFNVDDLDRAQNDINAIDAYTRETAVASANYLDSYVMSFYSSANSANRISNGGSALDITGTSAGSTHVYDLLVEAAQNLDELNVASDGRWAIVSPYYKSLLMKDTVYFIKGTDLGDRLLRTSSLTASAALNRGFIGEAAGFEIYVSNNLPTSGTSRYCLYGQGKPISLAAQIPPGTLEPIRRQDTFGTSIRGLLLHGGKVFDEHAKRLGYILVDNS